MCSLFLRKRITELEQENQNLKQQIANQNQIETQIQPSEQQFRKIFESSNDAISIIDPQAEKLLGYSRQELLNSVTVSSIHPEEMPRLMAFTKTILAVGEGWTNELTCLTKCGQKRPAEISATVINFGSRPCIVALVRDISERLKAQKEAMQATEKLAEIGELASMIVHEIRNPLTTVLMGLESLQKLDLPPRENARLDLASEEAHRLQSLLEEIRLYAKPEIIEKERINLNQLGKEIIENYANNYSTVKQVQFIPALESLFVSGDKKKLKQVFVNLLSNGLEAINTSEKVTLKIYRKQHSAIALFHNNGSPIPPEILPRLTQPFFTTKSSGTGLGLAIVKRIMDTHQGELKITSNAAEGTTITLDFPIAQP